LHIARPVCRPDDDQRNGRSRDDDGHPVSPRPAPRRTIGVDALPHLRAKARRWLDVERIGQRA
jgi:hypothetical protein